MPQKIQVANVRLDAEAQVIVINSRLCMKAAKCCWLAENLLKSLTGAETECDEVSLTEEIYEFLNELCRALEGDE